MRPAFPIADVTIACLLREDDSEKDGWGLDAKSAGKLSKFRVSKEIGESGCRYFRHPARPAGLSLGPHTASFP
jgi:hypothetical protein